MKIKGEVDWFVVIFISVFVLIAALIIWCLLALSNHNYDRFMGECKRYEKRYQCVAKWRAGNSNFVPMPVIIPMSR
jgi:hypothetical protein